MTELSPDDWVYEELMSYVFTHRDMEDTENIKFVSQLMRESLVDRFHIAIIPTLLGSGVRLFDTIGAEQKLQMVGIETYNGITELIYEKRGQIRCS